MTPAPATTQRTLKVQRQFFDLDSFDTVTVGKMIPFAPVQSVEEALAECGNNTDKLLALINEGREAATRENARATSDGWYLMDDNNQPSKDQFEGTPADPTSVNSLRMTFAKTMFGYVSGRNQSDEQKKTNEAARAGADEFIKNTPAIREKLKASILSEESD